MNGWNVRPCLIHPLHAASELPFFLLNRQFPDAQSVLVQHFSFSAHVSHFFEPPHPVQPFPVEHVQSVMGPDAAGFVHTYDVGFGVGRRVGRSVVGFLVGTGEGALVGSGLGAGDGAADGALVGATRHTPRGSLPKPGVVPGANGALHVFWAPRHSRPFAQSFAEQQPCPLVQVRHLLVPPQPHQPDAPPLVPFVAHFFHPVMGPPAAGLLHEKAVGRVVGLRLGFDVGAFVNVGATDGRVGVVVGYVDVGAVGAGVSFVGISVAIVGISVGVADVGESVGTGAAQNPVATTTGVGYSVGDSEPHRPDVHVVLTQSLRVLHLCPALQRLQPPVAGDPPQSMSVSLWSFFPLLHQK